MTLAFDDIVCEQCGATTMIMYLCGCGRHHCNTCEGDDDDDERRCVLCHALDETNNGEVTT